MKRITDLMPKKEITTVTLHSEPEVYEKLKAKLKKNKLTVREFFEASANRYLAEE